MKITCNHPASSYGVPVILGDAENVMDYGPGLTAVLERLGWTRAQFAEKSGYSPRTVEKFWQGAVPPAAALNLLGVHLEIAAADALRARAKGFLSAPEIDAAKNEGRD